MRNLVVTEKRGRFTCSSGSPIHIVYSPELQRDGSIKLMKIGEENTDEIIQSYYESTTLECILAKFAAGDVSVLNRYQPIYADLTTAPKTLAESLQTVINSRAAFDALPVDVRREFGMDFNKWLASAGSPSWMAAMASVLGSQSEAVAMNNNSAEKEVLQTADQ